MILKHKGSCVSWSNIGDSIDDKILYSIRRCLIGIEYTLPKDVKTKILSSCQNNRPNALINELNFDTGMLADAIFLIPKPLRVILIYFLSHLERFSLLLL